jgi:hypothetical protein
LASRAILPKSPNTCRPLLADAQFASLIDSTSSSRTTLGSDGKVKPSFTTLLAIATTSTSSWARRISPNAEATGA